MTVRNGSVVLLYMGYILFQDGDGPIDVRAVSAPMKEEESEVEPSVRDSDSLIQRDGVTKYKIWSPPLTVPLGLTVHL